MASERTASRRSAPLQAHKKKYATPHLTVYGGVIALTEAVGNMGNADGGGAPNTKTH